MKKTVLTFGLIMGAVMSVMMLLTLLFADDLGTGHSLVVGYTTMVLAGLLIFFGVRSYRDNVGGGEVRFGRAFAVGMLIVAISTVLYVATWELIRYQIAPGFAAKLETELEADAIAKERAKGGTPAEVEARVAQTRKNFENYRKPAFNAAMTFMEPLPVGLVLALVSAGILSRRRRGAQPARAGAAG